MPPRRRPPVEPPITPDDLAALAEALRAGRRATVYLREAVPALNLPAGASARVVSVTGSTVLVRPRGIDDELPFEADEIRLTRKQTASPEPEPAPKPAQQPVAAPSSESDSAPDQELPPKPPRAKPQTAAQPKAPAAVKKIADGVTVTIQGGLDNTWTVAVAYGSRPAGKPRNVASDAVERALAELGDPTAREAVDAVLTAARQAVATRIAELSRQLDEAKNALAALGSAE